MHSFPFCYICFFFFSGLSHIIGLKGKRMKRSTLTYVKQALNENGFSPLKKFGQNFLVDENVLDKIVRLAEPKNKNIFEVGPGLGALTERLAAEAKKVAAVEIDQGFFQILSRDFEADKNIKIISGDILKTDIKAVCREQFGDAPVTVAANLPYYITSACIMAFLTADIYLEKMVVMVQKEVAQRICAEAGSRDYGLLSVIIRYFGGPRLSMTVKRGCFYPRPDVDSAVVVIDIEKKYSPEAKTFIRFVKACFAMKRKTLVNNLIKAGISRGAAANALEELGLDTAVRAESLGMETFLSLANRLTL